MMEIGRAYNTDDLVPRRNLESSEFRNDWLNPQKLITGAAMTITQEQSRFMVMSFLHGDVADDIADRNVALLQSLQPHLLRAAQIQRQMAGARAKAQAVESAFDHMDRGVILLDTNGRSFYFNGRAQNCLARRDGLTLDHEGKILCREQRVQTKLDCAIAAAAATAAGSGHSAGDIIVIDRISSPLPWGVMVTPIPCRALDLGRSEGAVALFIVDPDQRPKLSVATSRALLGLTTAEARVAIALADGNTPEEIAEKQGISILTVRTHLRNAMAKTGINRLPELVALVLRSGAGLQP